MKSIYDSTPGGCRAKPVFIDIIPVSIVPYLFSLPIMVFLSIYLKKKLLFVLQQVDLDKCTFFLQIGQIFSISGFIKKNNIFVGNLLSK